VHVVDVGGVGEGEALVERLRRELGDGDPARRRHGRLVEGEVPDLGEDLTGNPPGVGLRLLPDHGHLRLEDVARLL
jgi:hypothetical protein